MAGATAIFAQVQRILQAPRPQLPTPVFYTAKRPCISLLEYTERLCQLMHCEPECYVLALVYLERIAQKGGLDEASVHRSLLLSLVLAAKFWDDERCKNTFYAQVGGVTVEELNELEVRVLRLLEFQLWVGEEVYADYQRRLRVSC